MRDVSDRIQAEEARRQSEERLRSIAETTGEWIWELDLAGRHTYSNPVIEKILGYRVEEIVGRDCFELIHPEDRPLARDLVISALREPRAWRGQILRWRHKAGHYRALESNAVLATDRSGKPVGLRGSDRDVTERLEIQEALRESEEPYRQLFEAVGDAVYVHELRADVTVDCAPDQIVLDQRRAEALYRVYCEAITISIRHAGAKSIRVSLKQDYD